MILYHCLCSSIRQSVSFSSKHRDLIYSLRNFCMSFVILITMGVSVQTERPCCHVSSFVEDQLRNRAASRATPDLDSVRIFVNGIAAKGFRKTVLLASKRSTYRCVTIYLMDVDGCWDNDRLMKSADKVNYRLTS